MSPEERDLCLQALAQAGDELMNILLNALLNNPDARGCERAILIENAEASDIRAVLKISIDLRPDIETVERIKKISLAENGPPGLIEVGEEEEEELDLTKVFSRKLS